MGGKTTYFYSNLRISRNIEMMEVDLTLMLGETKLFIIEKDKILMDTGFDSIAELSIPQNIFNHLCRVNLQDLDDVIMMEEINGPVFQRKWITKRSTKDFRGKDIPIEQYDDQNQYSLFCTKSRKKVDISISLTTANHWSISRAAATELGLLLMDEDVIKITELVEVLEVENEKKDEEIEKKDEEIEKKDKEIEKKDEEIENLKKEIKNLKKKIVV